MPPAPCAISICGSRNADRRGRRRRSRGRLVELTPIEPPPRSSDARSCSTPRTSLPTTPSARRPAARACTPCRTACTAAGLSTPLSTSPHCAAFGSVTRTPGTANRRSASHAAYASRSRSADCEMKPSPRHSKYGRSSNTSAMARERRAVALPGHDARCTGSRPPRAPRRAAAAASRSTAAGRAARSPDTTIGLPSSLRDPLVRTAADDRRDVARAR